MKISEKEFPGLFQSADTTSIIEQKMYFVGISAYLLLLIIAALFAYFSINNPNSTLKIISAILFLVTLTTMIWLKVKKPDDIWYNSRAVAESVKTRSWRWMMRAEPYEDHEDIQVVNRNFLNDLKTILKQNRSLFGKLGISASKLKPITSKMREIRDMSLSNRLLFYKEERITEQELWYIKKVKYNKRKSRNWFIISVLFHLIAIILLLYNIKEPHLNFPIEVLAVSASAVITWIEARKFNELSSSYTLTAHDISLIKAETVHVGNESELSEYVLNCENAFSREHTQWFARKNE